MELKEKLYHEKFFYKSKREFDFVEIRKFIQVNGGRNWELNFGQKMDKVSVPSCFVSARLKSVFGESWQSFEKTITRKNRKGEYETKRYLIGDVWHILFSFEDEEYFDEFLVDVLELDQNQTKELKTLFNNFPVGYANLSLKAINNILPFLRKGMIYSEAVILAKIPEILGEGVFEAAKEIIFTAVKDEIEANRYQKKIVAITNNLIFKYYALGFQDRFGWKDTSYKLDESDLKDIEIAAMEHFGDKTWIALDDKYKNQLLSEVTERYQAFFASTKREHLNPPHLVNQIKQFLDDNFNVEEKRLEKIYHPSQVDIYPSKEGQVYLESPKTAAFKNPMAYKTLYKLRYVINYLIEIGKIDNETRIVVEIARNLNDANKRWAIAKYKRDREAENRGFAVAIEELLKEPNFSGNANSQNDSDIDKFRIWTEQLENSDEVKSEISSIENNKKISASEKDIMKYRLWKEQNCFCLYTGKPIKLTDLFDKNTIDFEHTIPRSKSFDNSLANLTVCYSDYNRNIKKNKLPVELPNYENNAIGYSAIKTRLTTWEKKAEDLFNQIEFWKNKSKRAMDKIERDYAIRQRHLKQMDYDYWENKLNRFTRSEIPQGFVKSQLTDTQIITKYAFHYLKTVFNKVDVVKGSNTAQFRKIYGIQPKEEAKDRRKHYHHAIDAAVLTLIPSAKKREETLRMSYEFEEKHLGKQYTENPFPGFSYSMIEEIQQNILINNIPEKDQTLTPGIKKVRKRGKVVWLRDKAGKFLQDENGNNIPKIAQGDSIRGELHQQTYYGKIKIAAKDENGSLQRNGEGTIVYKQVNGRDEIRMVIRVNISEGKFNPDNVVDDTLRKYIQNQIKNSVKTSELLDFQGKKIRRIRCWVNSGRGLMNPDNVTAVKEQVYKSSKDYKNYTYADSGENYLFGLYENAEGRDIISINKYEAALYIERIGRPNNKEELFREKEPIFIKKKEASLTHVFEVGQKVIFYNTLDELRDIENDTTEISKRLYFIKRLHQASVGNMLFQHHLEARSDEELTKAFPKKQYSSAGKDGFSKYQVDFIAPRILFKPTKPTFIIEGKDFEMKLDGSIKFNF